MEHLLYALPLVACPLGMLLMMWLMGKGISPGTKSASDQSPRSIEGLRADQQRLAGEIEELERRSGNQRLASERRAVPDRPAIPT